MWWVNTDGLEQSVRREDDDDEDDGRDESELFISVWRRRWLCHYYT